MKTATQLEEILFDDPALTTYALLDGASIPDLLEYLDSLQPEYVCLYRGELKAGVDEVAPYLVQLEEGHSFTRWLLDKGWGEHYGVFVQSAEPITVVRLHLRRSLRVYTEEGKGLLFRYYDPRVLRVFLPSMTAEEAKAFFGPVKAFLSEAEDPSRILRFLKKGGAAIEESRPVAGPDGWQRVSG